MSTDPTGATARGDGSVAPWWASRRRRLAQAVQDAVAAELAETARGLSGADAKEMARHLAWSELESRLSRDIEAGLTLPSVEDEQALVESVLASMFGLGEAIEALLADPSIEQVDINGCDVVWVRYADGSKEQVDPVAASDEELVAMLRGAAARLGLSERPLDAAHPIANFRHPSGARISVAIGVTRRPAVSIRRHRLMDVRLADLVALGTLTDELAAFLAAAVSDRANILISGPTDAGKSTLLRGMIAEASGRDRIVLIEDDAELALDQMPDRHPDCVALEARPANTEGEGAVSMADLVRHSLRMAADRTILGEARSGSEVVALLQVMSQGRGGSLATLHSYSSAGAFQRLAMYAAASPERYNTEAANLLIAGAVHFVVHIDLIYEARSRRAPTSGPPWRFGPEDSFRRVVTSVREITGAEGLMVISNEIFRPGPEGRALPGVPIRTERLDRLAAHGYVPGDGR